MIDEDAPFEEIERLERELAEKNEILDALKGALDREVYYEISGKQQILIFVYKGDPGYETIKKWLEEEE